MEHDVCYIFVNSKDFFFLVYILLMDWYWIIIKRVLFSGINLLVDKYFK